MPPQPQKTWIKVLQIVLVRNGLSLIGFGPLLLLSIAYSFGDGEGPSFFKDHSVLLYAYLSVIFLLSLFLAYRFKSKSFVSTDLYKIPLYVGLIELVIIIFNNVLTRFFPLSIVVPIGLIPLIFSVMYSLLSYNHFSLVLIIVDCILGYSFIWLFLKKNLKS